MCDFFSRVLFFPIFKSDSVDFYFFRFRFGPRFPPMNKAYSTSLLEIGSQVAEEMGIADIVHKGVYTCLGGPSFETVAELKMLRMVGVDAVGKFYFFSPFYQKRGWKKFETKKKWFLQIIEF